MLIKKLQTKKMKIMLSITKCKKILNKNGISYNDDEVLLIRTVLYKYAEVAHNIVERKKRLSK